MYSILSWIYHSCLKSISRQAEYHLTGALKIALERAPAILQLAGERLFYRCSGGRPVYLSVRITVQTPTRQLFCSHKSTKKRLTLESGSDQFAGVQGSENLACTESTMVFGYRIFVRTPVVEFRPL